MAHGPSRLRSLALQQLTGSLVSHRQYLFAKGVQRWMPATDRCIALPPQTDANG